MSRLINSLFLIIKPTRCTNFSNFILGMKLYMFLRVLLSIIRSFFTVHTAVVYVIQVCWQLASRFRMERMEHPDPARKLSAYLYYTGCPRRNVPDFGRMFLMLKYTDITQNTYIQIWTVTEIMARERCGLLAVPRTVPVKMTRYPYTAHVRPWEWNAVNVATAM